MYVCVYGCLCVRVCVRVYVCVYVCGQADRATSLTFFKLKKFRAGTVYKCTPAEYCKGVYMASLLNLMFVVVICSGTSEAPNPYYRTTNTLLQEPRLGFLGFEYVYVQPPIQL